MIREYLKDNILITDGAMGTYYSEISGNDISYCEFANLNDKDTILKIHKKYIKCGAKLIRTNTFCANAFELDVKLDTLKSIIKNAVAIAKEAVGGTDVFIGASIGPIRNLDLLNEEEEVLNQYKYIVDCFLDENIDIFIFETFSNCNNLREISEYIKSKNKNAFILTQFAIKPDKFTRDGLSMNNIVNTIKNIKVIDSYGFNCGCGPAHLCNMVKDLNIANDIVSVIPNAGFPEIIHERTVYPNSPKYFAKRVNELRKYGISILGGCCGTNPSYIKELVLCSDEKVKPEYMSKNIKVKEVYRNNKIKNAFKTKLDNNEFVIAVELSSPMDTDIKNIINNAKICKMNKIDLITIPDSPMSRVRADSAIIAAKIKREVKIETMPHICCRDKNLNAIRSSLIGSNIEDIRNILAITGDPVSDANKIETKSVFNLNSFKLINLIKNMNLDVFNENSMYIGGALNLNVVNKKNEFERMKKKIECGASFFLTQPIYDEDAIRFLKDIKNKCDTKILAGIMPIVSYKNAVFLNNELPGVTIPEKIISRFDKNLNREESEKIGIEIAVEIGERLKDICDGFYFIIPFNRVNMVMSIIDRLKVTNK